MRKAVFLIGVFDECGHRNGGDYLSPESMALLTEVEEHAGLEAHIVFAVTDRKFAGKEKGVKLVDIKKERARVIREINEVDPEYVFCFGRTALSAAHNRGSLTLDRFRRDSFRIDGCAGTFHVVDSLARTRAQSGIRKWIKLDIHAAVMGLNGTEWGDYTVLQPDTPEWDMCPLGYESWDTGDMVGFDLETYQGLDPWEEGARIRMAMLSRTPGEAVVVQLPMDSTMPLWLEDILADDTIVKCGSNIAFDYKWCQRFGIEVNNMWDTSVAEHILDENDPNTGLKYLTLRYLPRLGDYSRDHRNLVKERGGWEHVRDDEQYLYAAADAEASVAAGLAQRDAISANGLCIPHLLATKLYPVLAGMQAMGTHIDIEVVKQLSVHYEQHLGVLRKRICRVLGPINPASPPQLAEALVAAVPGINLSKRILTQWWQDRWGDDADEVSTQKSILEREAAKHAVIADVLEFRKWNKMYGTYIKGVLEKHLKSHSGGHYVHPSFNQNRVETHRLSSSNPNLQNIPREPGEDDPPELNVKKMFCSRFEGGSIMEADFSQIELRMAAMLSGDEVMLDAFRSGKDLHKLTAAAAFGVPEDEVTKEQRQAAKVVNFGIIYGMGANTLGKATGYGKETAKRFIDGYFAAYPQLCTYIDSVHAGVRQTLQVESPFGFRRSFTEPPAKPDGSDRWNQWEGWRIYKQALNAIVQNTAACVTYVAIIEVDRRMKELRLKSKLFGTVHDSILADIYPGEEYVMAYLLQEVMENPPTEEYGVTLTVPMVADIEMGTTWGDKKEFDFSS